MVKVGFDGQHCIGWLKLYWMAKTGLNGQQIPYLRW